MSSLRQHDQKHVNTELFLHSLTMQTEANIFRTTRPRTRVSRTFGHFLFFMCSALKTSHLVLQDLWTLRNPDPFIPLCILGINFQLSTHLSVIFYLSSKVVSCCQVFESVQAVPMSCAASTRVMMDNLTDQWRDRHVCIT